MTYEVKTSMFNEAEHESCISMISLEIHNEVENQMDNKEEVKERSKEEAIDYAKGLRTKECADLILYHNDEYGSDMPLNHKIGAIYIDEVLYDMAIDITKQHIFNSLKTRRNE